MLGDAPDFFYVADAKHRQTPFPYEGPGQKSPEFRARGL
jgi:hypothetical protein